MAFTLLPRRANTNNENYQTRPRVVGMRPRVTSSQPMEVPVEVKPPKVTLLPRSEVKEMVPMPPAPEITYNQQPQANGLQTSNNISGNATTNATNNTSGFVLLPREQLVETRNRLTNNLDYYPQTRDRYVGEVPIDEQVARAETYVKALRNAPIENENGFWKGLGKSVLYGLQAFNRPIRDWNDFANAAGDVAGYGVVGAFDRKLDEKLDRQRDIAKAEKDYQFKLLERDRTNRNEKEKAQLELLKRKPELEAEKNLNSDLDRRRRAIVSLFNGLQEFDPDAPENADLVQEMKALDLPTPKKTKGMQFKLDQDPQTGEWRIIAIDKSTGQATASPVTQDGRPLVTTSKQKFAQDWKSAESDKQRQAILQKAAADRATRLQIADKRLQSKEYTGEQYYQELNSQLEDAHAELSLLQSQISELEQSGKTVDPWMYSERKRLRRETKSLGVKVARENDKINRSKASQSGGGTSGRKFTVQQITERGRARGASDAEIKQAIENARKAGKLQE